MKIRNNLKVFYIVFLVNINFISGNKHVFMILVLVNISPEPNSSAVVKKREKVIM